MSISRRVRASRPRPSHRALSAATLVAAACSVASVQAASFGHSRLISAIGEPLRIDVPVTQLSEAEAGSLEIRPAPASAWQTAGLTPPVELDSLKAQLHEGYRRDSYIVRVSSEQVFEQPIADLLLDMHTRSGVQRYQVSLLARGGAPAPRAPSAQPLSSQQGSASAEAAQSQTATVRKGMPTRTIPVRKGDHMFRIARQNAVPGVTVYQMMIALQHANPRAFIRSNLNLVRAGASLTMPDNDALTAISDREARRLFHEQVVAFELYRRSLHGTAVTAQAVSEAERAADKLMASIDGVSNVPAERAASVDQLKLSSAGVQQPASAPGGEAPAQDTGTTASSTARLSAAAPGALGGAGQTAEAPGVPGNQHPGQQDAMDTATKASTPSAGDAAAASRTAAGITKAKEGSMATGAASGHATTVSPDSSQSGMTATEAAHAAAATPSGSSGRAEQAAKGQPGTPQQRTEQSGTGQSSTGTGQLGTSQPRTEQSGIGQSDTAKSSTGQSSTERPGTEGHDTGPADAQASDSDQPRIAQGSAGDTTHNAALVSSGPAANGGEDGTDLADDGTRADDTLARRKAIDDAQARISQLEENVKTLNKALQSQGEAAKDLVVDGAIGLRQSLTDVATAVTEATIGDEEPGTSNARVDDANTASKKPDTGAVRPGPAQDAQDNTMNTIASWFQAHLMGVVTVLLALAVLLIAWMLRRANIAQSRSEAAITPDMVQAKLDQINLDLHDPDAESAPPSRP